MVTLCLQVDFSFSLILVSLVLLVPAISTNERTKYLEVAVKRNKQSGINESGAGFINCTKFSIEVIFLLKHSNTINDDIPRKHTSSSSQE